MMNKRELRMPIIAALATCLCATAVVATETDHYQDLDCWTAPSLTGGATIVWADPTEEETAASTKTQSVGFNFDADTVEEIHCYTHLPGNYSDSAMPTVVINGWMVETTVCSLAAQDAKFDVKSRAYAAGELLDDAWIGSGTATATQPCVGVSIDPDYLFQLSMSATTSASDWEPDDLVFIRIQRDADSGSDDYSDDFHVSRVRLYFKVTL